MSSDVKNQGDELLRGLRMQADQGALVQRRTYQYVILDHGREMGPVIKSGQAHADLNGCFANAQLLMKQRESLLYCEGYALSVATGVTMHHGWCLDADGRVLDPTWERHSRVSTWYYGLTFAREYALRRLEAQLQTGVVGSLLVLCADRDNGLVT